MLTFEVVPRMASTKEISTSEWMVVPSRRRPAGWGFTEMNTYRSPGSPPLRPTLPSPLTLSLLPASTPARALQSFNLSAPRQPVKQDGQEHRAYAAQTTGTTQ